MLAQLTPTRFAAALVVLLFHFGAGVPGLAGGWSSVLLRDGPTAVTWFFTLSGFILATVHAELPRAGAARFWWARFARIFPLYILALSIEAWLLGRWPRHDWPTWLLSASLLQAWVPGYVQTLNVPGWSLSVEALFYALFPVLIGLARRLGPAAWCGLAVLFWATTQGAYLAALNWLTITYPSRTHDLLHYFPPLHIGSFVVGMAAAGLWRRRAVPPGVGVAMIAVGMAAWFLAETWARGFAARHLLLLDFGDGLLAPAFALVLCGLVSTPLRPLRWPPLLLLGEASYALYLLQFPLYTTWVVQVRPRLGVGPALDLAGFVVLLVAVAIAAHLAIERPCRAWLRAAVRPSRAVRPPPAGRTPPPSGSAYRHGAAGQ